MTQRDEFRDPPEKGKSIPQGATKVSILAIGPVDFSSKKNQKKDPNECRYNYSIIYRHPDLEKDQAIDILFNIKKDENGDVIFSRSKEGNNGFWRFIDALKGMGFVVQVAPSGKIKIMDEVYTSLESLVEEVNKVIASSFGSGDSIAWTYAYKRPGSSFTNLMETLHRTEEEAVKAFEDNKDFLMKPMPEKKGDKNKSGSESERDEYNL